MRHWITWLVLMCMLWSIPVGLDIGLRSTPDVVSARVGAGTFVSSSGAPGGIWTRPSTTIQTTTGSMIVTGSFSGSRGQRLVLERKLKSGLVLCTESGLVCAPLAGPWPGQLQTVTCTRPPLAILAKWSGSLPQLYFVALLLSFSVSVLYLAARVTSGEDGANEPDKQDGEAGKAAM